MKTVTIQDIKRHGSKTFASDEPVYLIVHSKPKFVILPLLMYEKIVKRIETLKNRRNVS